MERGDQREGGIREREGIRERGDQRELVEIDGEGGSEREGGNRWRERG